MTFHPPARAHTWHTPRALSLMEGVLGSLEENVDDFFAEMSISGGAHGHVLHPSLQVRPSFRLQPGLGASLPLFLYKSRVGNVAV